jgi:hypothetical protein
MPIPEPLDISMTPKQKEYINRLIVRAKYDEAECDYFALEQFGVERWQELNKFQASKLIDFLKLMQTVLDPDNPY